MNLKKSNSQNQQIEWWLPGAGKHKKWGDVGQRVQQTLS